MATFNQIVDYLWKIVSEVDERTNDSFLVACPKTVFGLLILYIMWSKVLGPKYMENQKPYRLKLLINLFNVFQIIACGYLGFMFITYGAIADNIWSCKAVDFSVNPTAMYVSKLIWLSYFMKLIDLLETVLFSLRKKWNQITFLHLYHHTMTLIFVWIAVRYHPGGIAAQVFGVNNLVHFFMYLYYTFAANASAKSRARFLPLKKMITILQLIQFVMFFLWGLQSYFVEACSSERRVCLYVVPYVASLLYLFSAFYIKTYHGEKIKL